MGFNDIQQNSCNFSNQISLVLQIMYLYWLVICSLLQLWPHLQDTRTGLSPRNRRMKWRFPMSSSDVLSEKEGPRSRKLGKLKNRVKQSYLNRFYNWQKLPPILHLEIFSNAFFLFILTILYDIIKSQFLGLMHVRKTLVLCTLHAWIDPFVYFLAILKAIFEVVAFVSWGHLLIPRLKILPIWN